MLQVKTPLPPATGPQQVRSKGAEYPERIMKDIFGKGEDRGRESYGLRFVSCEMPELLGLCRRGGVIHRDNSG